MQASCLVALATLGVIILSIMITLFDYDETVKDKLLEYIKEKGCRIDIMITLFFYDEKVKEKFFVSSIRQKRISKSYTMSID